eukprot:1085912-Rhodomonas_salina.1
MNPSDTAANIIAGAEGFHRSVSSDFSPRLRVVLAAPALCHPRSFLSILICSNYSTKMVLQIASPLPFLTHLRVNAGCRLRDRGPRHWELGGGEELCCRSFGDRRTWPAPVSYTHLTLPTICSV